VEIRNQLRIIQFHDAVAVEAILARLERTSRQSRYQWQEDEEVSGHPPAPHAISRAKPKTRVSFASPVEGESRPRTKAASRFLAQLEPEPEDSEDEYAAYSIEDEEGREQVYLARVKDVVLQRTVVREDRERENCPTVASLVIVPPSVG